MRKTTASVVNAFLSGRPAAEGKASTDGKVILLHGRRIVEYVEGTNDTEVMVSDGGYPLSLLTKRYLNAIPGVSVSTVQGIHFLNGMIWDGMPFRVKLAA